MLNALLKKRKGNKGFTLIELIVVIAIIAILALLLVPRFLGFTDSAKAKSDIATMKTIQTAIIALASDGTISGAGSFTMPNSDGTFGIADIGTIKPDTAADLKIAVQKLTGNAYKAQESGKGGFKVTITTSDVTVSAISIP